MTVSSSPSRWNAPLPFVNYRIDRAYDEMFESPGVPREQYQALHQTLLNLPPEELRKSQQAADLAFLHEGISFTVYGSKEGMKRYFERVCCTLVPRQNCCPVSGNV